MPQSTLKCDLSLYNLDTLVRDGSGVLYHGTTRQFDSFDVGKLRQELVGKYYDARAVFLSPVYSVAERYAEARRNAELPATLVDDLAEISPDAGEVLRRLVAEGQAAWEGLFEEAVARYPDAPSPFEALELMAGVDPNTLMDISEHIEGSRYGKSEEALTLFDLWGSTLKGTPDHIFKDIENVGLDADRYRPKVYTVAVSGLDRVLVTRSKAEAAKAKARGYDAIIWCGSDLVSGVPEVAVLDHRKVRVVKRDVI